MDPIKRNSIQASPEPSSSVSPLMKQNPMSPLFSPTTPDATQTIFLNHPALRISSSPASSPCIIDPPPARRGSVRPTMSKTMESGVNPGADFFDDSSGSEWEDSEGDISQSFPLGDGLGLGSLVHDLGIDKERVSRGRSRERDAITALPSYHALSSHFDSGLGISSPVDSKGTRRARPMSLRRLNRDDVHVVHNRSSGCTPRSSGTPQDSIRSDDSDAASLAAETRTPFYMMHPEQAYTTRPRSSNSFQRHYRKNTSESILTDSIIDAHITTMRALEARSPSPTKSNSNPPSRTFFRSSASTDFPTFSSFSNSRQITMSPLSTVDHQRPAHLPNHFVKTPYPFGAKKEFPKPDQRPRQRDLARLDSGYDDAANRGLDARKGKHVLGLPTSGGKIDLRSRQERNDDAQGVIRSRVNSGIESQESVVWLTLQRRAPVPAAPVPTHRRLVRVDVPSSLAVRSPDHTGRKGNPIVEIEFDDNIFAQRLRAGYRELAGNWFTRRFSARKLRYIQLGQTSIWSGNPTQESRFIVPGLLTVGDGVDSCSDSRSPFTEDGLMKLYRSPKTGQARYTWVHWARRVAAWNHVAPLSPKSERSLARSSQKSARSPNSPTQFGEKSAFSVFSDDGANSKSSADMITTIQFVESLSISRVIAALILMLALSVVAAVLWVVVGPRGLGGKAEQGLQMSDRVGPAMAIAILTLLIEGLGFGAWIWLS